MAEISGSLNNQGTEFGPRSQRPSQQPGESSQKSPGSCSNDAGSFDCNICLELAQDPVVTLCGHLFCWPCLYRWLRGHSTCQECPVCKAVVEEEKVVPLYGRGKVGSGDPRKKSVPEINVPHRPTGQRPETARPQENQFQQGFNFMAGHGGPMATARFGNFTFSAGFGFFPSLFGFHVQSFQDGLGPGYPFGPHMGWQTANPHVSHSMIPDQQQEATLSKLLLFVGILVVLCVMFF